MVFLLYFSREGFSLEQSEIHKKNIPYYSEAINKTDSYIRERAVLDVYCPQHGIPLPTIVWFHGGGLSGGVKYLPEELVQKNVCVVAVNYRLYPKVKAPTYIEDASAAVAWVFNNIENFGGDPSLIFLSGHSAGGYLASMIGLDKHWLAKHGINANKIAGLIPFSGHTITDFTVREERGIPGTRPIVDALAPLYHVRAGAPPLLLITGDRELEMLGRYEENAYMMRMMKVVGHTQSNIIELKDYGHDMAHPAFPLLLEEVARIVAVKPTKSAKN